MEKIGNQIHVCTYSNVKRQLYKAGLMLVFGIFECFVKSFLVIFRIRLKTHNHVKISFRRYKLIEQLEKSFEPLSDRIEDSCEILSKFMTVNGISSDSQVCQQPLNPVAYQFKGSNTTQLTIMEICCLLNRYYQFGLNDALRGANSEFGKAR